MKKFWRRGVISLFCLFSFNVVADEYLPVLQVGSEVYSNVTITSVTATDIYFSHAKGMGNAKLKNLAPDLQKHFKFNAAKAGELDRQQRDANAQYRQQLIARQPPRNARSETAGASGTSDGDDLIVPKLYAKSFRGQPPPQIFVSQWLNLPPNMNGKFVLVDFWATWCGPCRKSIPHLNELSQKFKDRLVVIGLSDESAEAVQKMTSPRITYAVGVDPGARTSRAAEITGIPHAMLIDPKGIVRFEGMPSYLTDDALEHLLAKYGE